MNRKVISVLVCVLLAVSMLAAGCGSSGETGNTSAPAKVFINIATGGTSGTYFPLGGALGEIWNKNIPGMNATAQSTGASVANVNLLNDGKADVIMVQNDIAYYAVNGTEMFNNKKVDGMVGLASLYPETIQIVAKEDQKIKSIADLKGKKVAVGAAGSGTEANARQILEAAGITYKDITVQYLSFAEAASNLKDGNVDAAFLTAGHPTAAVQDIAAQHKIQILPIEDALADKIIAKYPFYTKVVVGADTYKGMTAESKTLAVQAMLVVSSKMDDKMAYDLVKYMYGNLDRIKAAHKVGEQITKDNGTAGMPITLHPGAEKFFSGN